MTGCYVLIIPMWFQMDLIGTVQTEVEDRDWGGETMWSLQTRATGDAVLTYSYQNESNTRLPASRTVTFMIGVR